MTDNLTPPQVPYPGAVPRLADRTRTGERILSVVVLGPNLTVTVTGDYVDTLITAFDGDSNPLAVLARVSGPVPDPILSAAYDTARRLFPDHARIVTA